MKSKGQILQKIKQASYRHLKRELSRLLSQRSFNCQNNRLVKLPQEIGEIRVCALDCQICDPASDDRAKSCGLFEPKHDKDEIRESLKRFFLERPVNELAVRFPDVAALLWTILDDSDPQRGDLLPDACPTHSLFGVPLWVDKEEDLQGVREYLERLSRDHESIKSIRLMLNEALLEEEEGSEDFDPAYRVRELLRDYKEEQERSSRLASQVRELEIAVSNLISDRDTLNRIEVRRRGDSDVNSRSWWARLWS